MKSQVSLKKICECRDRNPASKTYYALLKVKGKQIKNSLETAGAIKSSIEGWRVGADLRADRSGGPGTSRPASSLTRFSSHPEPAD